MQLDPKTVDLTFATDPAGGAMTVGEGGVFSPHTRTFIVGSAVDVSVPEVRTVGGVTYAFAGWSDGGPRAHSAQAPAAATTYTARYVAQDTGQPTRRGTVVVRVKPTGLDVKVDGTRRSHGWTRRFDVGTVLRLAAPRVQWRKGVKYEFVRWSDGGHRRHRVVVTGGRLAVRAVYRPQT